eukprot:gnl/TRDRNA2_/TRDRNA2_187099_c0_seq1.p1 gnl/TRDRNA2_/TRDRNA2_187099_c0~~gnl/TRDRNA2_/TRDRNA2_187099_c0_seq1.p1  ORF type:complete len:130 (-),score=50.68 gnl/TRDRNA2_/TRDRNA2_187099_c0_seq1:182-571(-)
MSLKLLVVLCLAVFAAGDVLAPDTAKAVQQRNDALRASFKSMMQDDDDDDDFGDESGKPAATGLMQQSTDESMDSYMESSANALSSELGPRWNGKKLEADAKEKTQAFLKGLGGNKALGSLNAMLGAMR